jgi:hypothetical protein
LIPDEYVYAGGALIVILIIAIICLYHYYNREIRFIIEDYESQIRRLQMKSQGASSRIGSKSTIANKTVLSSDKLVVETRYNVETKPEEKLNKTVSKPEIEEVKKEEQKTVYTYLIPSGKERFSQSFRGPEKCFFRMWEEGNVLKYEFSGNVDKALANLNAVFDDTCHLQGSQMNARSIINIYPGELDSQLNIIKKAVIKLVE